MTTMLTTKDVQELINVDRSTIYRMAETGKLPAVKVGRQWRFPASEIEAWLAVDSETKAESEAGYETTTDLSTMLLPGVAKPLADLLGDIFGVMVLVTDLEGEPLIEPSNPCGLFQFVHQLPAAELLCSGTWREFATDEDPSPGFRSTPLGFECARGFIRVGIDLKGMVIMGGVATADWPPPPEQIQILADKLDVDVSQLAQHVDEVFYLEPGRQSSIIEFLPRISSLFSRIARERSRLVDRLDTIASLAGSDQRSDT
jgi:excisionase family DNA binding protein